MPSTYYNDNQGGGLVRRPSRGGSLGGGLIERPGLVAVPGQQQPARPFPGGPSVGRPSVPSLYAPRGCADLSMLEQMELGRRFPRPYDAALAEVQAENQAWFPVQQMHPRHAAFVGRDIAGQRRWSRGGYGVGTPDWQMDPRGARQRIGARTDGGRGIGLLDAYDLDGSNFRYSGSLPVGTTQTTSQRVPCDRPVVRLLATGGMMRVEATVGSQNGGTEDTREFFLGNGYTATFDLAAWDFFKCRVIQTDATAKLSYAWLSGQSAAGNQDLFLVQHMTVALADYDVPKGAYQAVFQTLDNSLLWLNNNVEDVGASTFDVTAPAGLKIDVLGFQVRPSGINRVAWVMRPF